MFVTKAIAARDPRGRSRDQIAADITNDGLGPDASVSGRDQAIEVLTYAIPVAGAVIYAPMLGLALLFRSTFGALATGNALALASTVIFPLLGLVIPMSLRLMFARRQLSAWTARGEPQDERPVDNSLPRVLDAVVGLTIGAVFSMMIILGVVLT